MLVGKETKGLAIEELKMSILSSQVVACIVSEHQTVKKELFLKKPAAKLKLKKFNFVFMLLYKQIFANLV